jgi:hypothetical protein
MTYDKLKKGLISLALAGSFVLGAGFTNDAIAQGRWDNRRNQWEERRERERERQMLERIRRMDRDRQLRYQYNGGNRLVGYYDRWGRFHAYGYYDRFGRFHNY